MWTAKMNINTKKTPNIRLMKNGHLLNTVYKIKKQQVALQNTCAFDSMTQILSAAYAYYPEYKAFADSMKESAIYEIASLLTEK